VSERAGLLEMVHVRTDPGWTVGRVVIRDIVRVRDSEI